MTTTTIPAFKRKLIGKGAFTKAYQIAVDKVEVVTVCPAKECYAMFSQGNPFAPKIESVDTRADGKRVYHMPLYPKMKALTRQLNVGSLSVYRELRKLMQVWVQNPSYNTFCNQVDGLRICPSTKEYIKELAGDVCNSIDCNDLRFEISPRNVTCDKDGNLIMLDCFFCAKTLRKTKGWHVF